MTTNQVEEPNHREQAEHIRAFLRRVQPAQRPGPRSARAYFDVASLMQQLGVAPPAA